MAAELLSQSKFAARIGMTRQYVSKLKQEGRLVMAGKLVDVAASLARIEETQGTRDDVAQRHADERGGVITLTEAKSLKAISEARRVAALADREEMERDRMAGELIAREDVDAAMKFIGATVRSLLDVLPDQTAPIVTPVTSLEECHALLTEACRNVLHGLGDAIEKQRAALDGKGA